MENGRALHLTAGEPKNQEDGGHSRAVPRWGRLPDARVRLGGAGLRPGRRWTDRSSSSFAKSEGKPLRPLRSWSEARHSRPTVGSEHEASSLRSPPRSTESIERPRWGVAHGPPQREDMAVAV